MIQNEDITFMRRCLQLAALGRGNVAPNPMVGAVIVHRGRIIGEGFHRCYGEAHAEVNAVASVREPSLLAESTLYVSLEPCSHYGKTPPCAELIIRHRIPRVVVGCLDPFPEVSGRGVALLREAGVEVVTGVLEEECRALNRTFMTYQLKQRPFITLKWAQSADGFIDRLRSVEEPATRLSDDISSVWVHRLRTECDAILVGTNTAFADNPTLTARLWCGHSPLRVVLDRHGRLPATAKLFTDGHPTLVITDKNTPLPGFPQGVEVLRLAPEEEAIPALLAELYRRRVQHLLVEGGSELLQSFIAKNLWDEARIEQAPINLGEGVPAPALTENPTQIELCGDAQIAWYENR